MLADWSGQGTGSESAGVETSAGSAGSSEEEEEGGGGGGYGLSSDGSLPTDADFASAVARAAELSGMTVVGTTVTDPKANGKKRSFVGRSGGGGGGGGRVQVNLGVMLRVGCSAEGGWKLRDSAGERWCKAESAGEPWCKAKGCGAARQCR